MFDTGFGMAWVPSEKATMNHNAWSVLICSVSLFFSCHYSSFAVTTELISVASGGNETNGSSNRPSLSRHGRWFAFESDADNLVVGDNNRAKDVFLYDRITGVTQRVSVATGGAEADGDSSQPSLSADGRWVAFVSQATNLVAADSNAEADVFVHDHLTGITQRVSAADDGSEANGRSSAPSISADGRWVAFESLANNLVPGDSNGVREVFVRDRVSSATRRVSVVSGGGEANGASLSPSISADGRWVAFTSLANNLVVGDGNGTADVFIHDLVAGTTQRVSVASDGSESNGFSIMPTVSANGAPGGLCLRWQ